MTLATSGLSTQALSNPFPAIGRGFVNSGKWIGKTVSKGWAKVVPFLKNIGHYILVAGKRAGHYTAIAAVATLGFLRTAPGVALIGFSLAAAIWKISSIKKLEGDDHKFARFAIRGAAILVGAASAGVVGFGLATSLTVPLI